MRFCLLAGALCAALAVAPAFAQAPAAPPAPPPNYGETITLDQAKKAVDAAEAEAKKNSWQMAIAIVSPSGDLVFFQKLDNTAYVSIQVAQMKAKAAAIYRRPTKVYEDRVASGGAGLGALTLPHVIASEGGVPIIVGGKLIGAIGVSGGTSQQDGIVAGIGSAAVK